MLVGDPDKLLSGEFQMIYGSRIDNCWISADLSQQAEDIEILPNTYTDHNLIWIMELGGAYKVIGSNSLFNAGIQIKAILTGGCPIFS